MKVYALYIKDKKTGRVEWAEHIFSSQKVLEQHKKIIKNECNEHYDVEAMTFIVPEEHQALYITRRHCDDGMHDDIFLHFEHAERYLQTWYNHHGKKPYNSICDIIVLPIPPSWYL